MKKKKRIKLLKLEIANLKDEIKDTEDYAIHCEKSYEEVLAELSALKKAVGVVV